MFSFNAFVYLVHLIMRAAICAACLRIPLPHMIVDSCFCLSILILLIVAVRLLTIGEAILHVRSLFVLAR